MGLPRPTIILSRILTSQSLLLMLCAEAQVCRLSEPVRIKRHTCAPASSTAPARRDLNPPSSPAPCGRSHDGLTSPPSLLPFGAGDGGRTWPSLPMQATCTRAIPACNYEAEPRERAS